MFKKQLARMIVFYYDLYVYFFNQKFYCVLLLEQYFKKLWIDRTETQI
jgi:hypothetical protein